ncbi:MAG: disulfide oxidoreductase [Alphaproteobacteria bacterium]|nr:disulfide oxidoreductase [Alphaproteobacteria bacterium]
MGGAASLGGRITAVLGPTNTGKTHLAMERMMGHVSGMIGFPLRLLARENYDRVARAKGEKAVALITGEEKIVPEHPRYFVCTVESMPVDRPVSFLAIDEIQLSADWERGHVFTDRLLHARGLDETMFLGAETIRPLLRKLVPRAEVVTRPRLSTLVYAGHRKLARLPRRSAVVAFSIANVYELAEAIRRQRGGAAVVMGALSPRVRNAQVAMFQAGEVDFLVATDAIGMGLNMDVDHVAFAQLSKFDGRAPRRLMPAELAQIAGRAGRHMANGTFGTTSDAGELDEGEVTRIEEHRFEPLQRLWWRNGDLDMRSLTALSRSLEAKPPSSLLMRKRDADDHLALQVLANDAEIRELAAARGGVRLLWEVCQIPDFRKILADAHTRLLGQIYRHLTGPTERLPTDWVARHVQALDRTDGDIDTLTQRIAHCRTWAYVAHRPDWVANAGNWRERARAIEERLSDALHERLTQRFVDRRAAALTQRLADGEDLVAAVRADGEVVVEGHAVGRLEGLRFVPDVGNEPEARPVMGAARRAVPREIAHRVDRLEAAGNGTFRLDGAALLWDGAPVARLVPGRSTIEPRIEVLANDYLDAAQRDRVVRRLATWLVRHVAQALGPLKALRDAPLDGAARGLAFRLVERLGTVPRGEADAQLVALGPADRKALARLGVRFGVHHVFLPVLAKPAAARLLALFWSVAAGRAPVDIPTGPAPAADPAVPRDFWTAVGRAVLGGLALGCDRIERLAFAARTLSAQGPFLATQRLVDLAGCRPGELAGVLADLGYRAEVGPDGTLFSPRVRNAARRRQRRKPAIDQGSPFAPLARLLRRP